MVLSESREAAPDGVRIIALIRLNNITRHVATLIAITGVAMLVPPVSAETALVQARALVFGGMGTIIRLIIAWYLATGVYRGSVQEVAGVKLQA